MKLKIPEIVAPSGTPECFIAALDAGADAVYAGPEGFNMRASAYGFSSDDIKRMSGIAHERGKKLYLALNIVVYDDETGAIADILDNAVNTGVDAVICWDPAVINFAHERGLRIHLSTQASVSNIEAVKFYAANGIKRIVLARELSLSQIGQVISQTGELGLNIEYECFVHGAMCLGVSGRCLMSNFLHGKSANRGECYQPCRRKYIVYDWERDKELAIENHTIMSAKDLCTVNILDKIINTGADALKIEGRMRNPGYVKKTVEIYRAARDTVIEGSFSDLKADVFRHELEKVFNRGFSNGFYLSRPDEEISETEGNISTELRSYRGKVTNYYPKQGAVDILIETGDISIGDIIQITGHTTGIIEFRAETIRDTLNTSVEKGLKGSIIGLKTPLKAREGDSVYVVEKR